MATKVYENKEIPDSNQIELNLTLLICSQVSSYEFKGENYKKRLCSAIGILIEIKKHVILMHIKVSSII